MTNQELETKIKEIIAIDNYFDMTEAICQFEKEYKQSDFYRATRQSLSDAVKNARVHYALQLEGIFKIIQKRINELDLTKINELINTFGDQLLSANEENQELLTDLKDTINNTIK